MKQNESTIIDRLEYIIGKQVGTIAMLEMEIERLRGELNGGGLEQTTTAGQKHKESNTGTNKPTTK